MSAWDFGCRSWSRLLQIAVIAATVNGCSVSKVYGIDISWNGSQNSNWQNGSNWNGGQVPDDGDSATLTTPADDSITLSANVLGIDDLTIQNGIDVNTQGFFLNVDDLGNAQTDLSGTDSAIFVAERSDVPSAHGFRTDRLSIGSGSFVQLIDGVAQGEVRTDIAAGGRIEGSGLFEFGTVFTGTTTVMSSAGTIAPGPAIVGSGQLILQTLGNGRLDLDGPGGIGTSETGVLDVDDSDAVFPGSVTLIVDGPLSDPFDGTIHIGRGDLLSFQDPWSFGFSIGQGPRVMNFNGGSGTARLIGAQLTASSGAVINVNSGTASLGAPITLNSASLNLAANTTATVSGLAVFNSSANVSVAANSNLKFLGGAAAATTAIIHGGTWTGDGTIVFGADDLFSSSTVVNSATMTVATVDLDGVAETDHHLTVNDGFFVLNVDSIDPGDGDGSPTNRFDDEMTLANGRLVVNFNKPSDTWVMNGSLELQGVTSGSGFNPQVQGADVELRGNTVLSEGRSGMLARVDVTGTVAINDVDAELSLTGGDTNNPNRIEGGTISGAGLLFSSRLHGFGAISSAVAGGITADDGTLTLSGSIVSGTFGASPDGVLNVTNPWGTDSLTTLAPSGGQIQGATITNDGTTSGFGEIALSGDFINNATLHPIGGTLSFNGSGSLDLDGTSGDGLVNVIDGDLHIVQGIGSQIFSGEINIGDGRELRIDAGGLAIQGVMNIEDGDYVGSDFDNAGTLNVNADVAAIIDANSEFSTGSTTNFNGPPGNRLELAGNVLVEAGASFSGDGTLLLSEFANANFEHAANVNVEVVNEGVVNIGDSPGLVTIADFTQTATGELALKIGGTTFGTEHDILVVPGLVALDGTLEVSLINGFEPTIGSAFEIIDVGGVLSGTFSGLPQAALVDNFAGTDLYIDYTADDGNDVALVATFAGDFDLDFDVDGYDFLIWQRGESPSPLSPADLADWQANYGMNVSPLYALAIVPEPSSLILICTIASGLIQRRMMATKPM